MVIILIIMLGIVLIIMITMMLMMELQMLMNNPVCKTAARSYCLSRFHITNSPEYLTSTAAVSAQFDHELIAFCTLRRFVTVRDGRLWSDIQL